MAGRFGDATAVSLNQQRLWYLDQLSPGNPAYDVPYLAHLAGDLDLAALKRAFHAVVERHKVLRTVYISRRGLPFPVLLPKWSVPFNHVDLRQLTLADREMESRRLIFEAGRYRFNLARDVKLRVLLVQLSNHEFFLLHISHHMVFEGGSVAVLYRELAFFYDAFTSGHDPIPPPLRSEFGDFIAWQNQRLQGTHLNELMDYWKQQLSGAPFVHLPLDRPRPAIQSMAGRRHNIVLPVDLVNAANDFFNTARTSSFRGLCAAFNVFLYCHTGITDISMGSPVSPRCPPELQDVIGFFVNTVVLRTRFSSEMTFRQLMTEVASVVRAAVEHSDLPFDKMVEAVRPPRESSRGPLFQVNFRAPKEPYPTLQLQGITAGRAVYVDNGTSKFDLAFEVESSEGKACYFEYAIDLFEQSTIEQMALDFQALLRGLIAQPDTPLKDLSEAKKISERVRNYNAAATAPLDRTHQSNRDRLPG